MICLAGKGFDGPFLYSRLLSVPLLSGLRLAGVFSGLDSGTTNHEPRRPTRQRAWWVLVLGTKEPGR